MANITELDKSFGYTGKSDEYPLDYNKRINLDYLTKRDIHIIKYLKRLAFIDDEKAILVGHSKGSRVASEIVFRSENLISNLVYLSGNPFGRRIHLIYEKRIAQNDDDFSKPDKVFKFWKKILRNKNEVVTGDWFSRKFENSKPYFRKLLNVKIPVFMAYGTKDPAFPYNDLFKLYVLLQNKQNFMVKPYIGLTPSFYKKNDEGIIKRDQHYWGVVMNDMLTWLKSSGE